MQRLRLPAHLHIPRFLEASSRSISHADHGLCKPSHNYTWQDHKAQDCCVVRTQQIHVVSPRSRQTFTDRQGGQTQYLTPYEEHALVDYVLHTSERGYPLPVKFLRSLALVIARQRCSSF
jgi:hypothetical protein